MTLNESKELLKERLAAIMKFKKSTATMVCISGLLAVGFLFGAAFAGAYQPEKIAPPTREAITEKTTLPNTTDEYSMTVYVGGQDISQEIIRLWHSANNIYNVDDSETFEMGESVFLFEIGPEYCELLTYDVEVDDVFTGNGKLQLEQTKIGGDFNLIQKQDGRIYRMGPWKTGYSYAEALDGMKVVDYSEDTLVLKVKYKEHVGLGDPPVFGYVDFTAKRVADQWYVDDYQYPEAYSVEDTGASIN